MAYYKQYHQVNKKRIAQQKKQYAQIHKDKIAKYQKQYRKDNREKLLEKRKQWQKDNPGHNKQWRKDNPEKRIEINKRQQFKRRNLGFFPLNEYFKGSEAHHISENFIIYIPVKIHRSIQHNIWAWRNMEKINKLAIELL